MALIDDSLAMIKAIFIVNNYGQARMIKFYEHVAEAVQQAAVREVYQLVSQRSDTQCNFVEPRQLRSMPTWHRGRSHVEGGHDDGVKIIYRHYATLFFVFVVEETESELGILDLIQVFVETLDKTFENVCELDLIFHIDQVHHILDEIVMGGLVLETNMGEVLKVMGEMDRMSKESLKGGGGGTPAGGAGGPGGGGGSSRSRRTSSGAKFMGAALRAARAGASVAKGAGGLAVAAAKKAKDARKGKSPKGGKGKESWRKF